MELLGKHWYGSAKTANTWIEPLGFQYLHRTQEIFRFTTIEVPIYSLAWDATRLSSYDALATTMYNPGVELAVWPPPQALSDTSMHVHQVAVACLFILPDQMNVDDGSVVGMIVGNQVVGVQKTKTLWHAESPAFVMHKTKLFGMHQTQLLADAIFHRFYSILYIALERGLPKAMLLARRKGSVWHAKMNGLHHGRHMFLALHTMLACLHATHPCTTSASCSVGLSLGALRQTRINYGLCC